MCFCHNLSKKLANSASNCAERHYAAVLKCLLIWSSHWIYGVSLCVWPSAWCVGGEPWMQSELLRPQWIARINGRLTERVLEGLANFFLWVYIVISLQKWGSWYLWSSGNGEGMEWSLLERTANMEMHCCPTSSVSELSTSLEQEENYSYICQVGGGAKARVLYTNAMIWLIEHFYSRLL